MIQQDRATFHDFPLGECTRRINGQAALSFEKLLDAGRSPSTYKNLVAHKKSITHRLFARGSINLNIKPRLLLAAE